MVFDCRNPSLFPWYRVHVLLRAVMGCAPGRQDAWLLRSRVSKIPRYRLVVYRSYEVCEACILPDTTSVGPRIGGDRDEII